MAFSTLTSPHLLQMFPAEWALSWIKNKKQQKGGGGEADGSSSSFSDQHWKYFKGNLPSTSLRQGWMRNYRLSRAQRYHLELYRTSSSSSWTATMWANPLFQWVLWGTLTKPLERQSINLNVSVKREIEADSKPRRQARQLTSRVTLSVTWIH